MSAATFQLLLEAPGATSIGAHLAFHRRVVGTLVPRLAALGPTRLRVAVTEAPPPRVAAVPFQRGAVALFSAEADDAAPLLAAVAPAGDERLGAWTVDVAAPLHQPRLWDPGARSPGAGLLSVFRKRPSLDHATFLRRWHEGHTPLTLEVHPVTAYHRSVVREPVRSGSPALDGIVEERFATSRDLLDPRRFYGGAGAMLPGALRVARDILGFLDVRSVRSWLVAELRVLEPS